MSDADLPIDFEQIVTHDRGIGFQRRLKGLDGEYLKGTVIDNPSTEISNIDLNRMCASAVISTATLDRVGDVLVPEGCELTDYEKNPVVLWSHGLEMGIPFPVGTARDPISNELSVQIKSDSVTSWCFFSQSYAPAVQIFGLIDEKIIRATSVRETPINASQRFKDGQTILYVPKWGLEEWSWCAVGVNPDAVRKCLDRNRIDGKQIVEPIYKALVPLAAKLKKPGKGFDMAGLKASNPNDLMQSDKSTKAEDETPQDEGGSSGDAKNTDDTGGEVAPEAEAGGEPPKDVDPKDAPYGKQLIDSTHDGIKSICKCLNEGVGDQLEHEGVKSDLADVNDSLKSMMAGLQASHAKHYPRFKCNLKSDDMDEGDSADEDEMKSFLAGSVLHRSSLAGMRHELKRLGDATNLNTAQKSLLKRLVGQCDRTMKSAKEFAPTQGNTESSLKSVDPEEQKRQALLKQLDDLKKLLPAQAS